MNKKCCAGWHSGNFCPHCGKKLRDANPLDSLLTHCQGQLNGVETRRRQTRLRIETAHERPHMNVDEQQVRLEVLDEHVMKWASWVTALRAAISPPKKKTRAVKKKKARRKISEDDNVGEYEPISVPDLP